MKKEINEEEKKQVLEWCANAIKIGMKEKDVNTKFNSYPKEVRNLVKETFRNLLDIKMKGGVIEMPKKYEEKYEEENEEEDDESYEDAPVLSKPTQTANPKQNWLVDYAPEKFRVVDPVRKKIILESNSAADLSIQLQVRILQKLTERL